MDHVADALLMHVGSSFGDIGCRVIWCDGQDAVQSQEVRWNSACPLCDQEENLW